MSGFLPFEEALTSWNSIEHSYRCMDAIERFVVDVLNSESTFLLVTSILFKGTPGSC